MNTKVASKDVVKGFFEAFGRGDFQGVLDAFDPSIEIMAVRNGEVQQNGLFGRYTGTDGLTAFLQNMGKTFDTKSFEVAHVGGDGNMAFANGSFVHEVKATEKLYEGEWALICEVERGKITSYKFYEDSESFLKANSN